METYVVKRLEQAKLLSDPFKLKLMERFAGKPSTTKQVADRMGEKAPRLYRHVDALVEEGLLELVEEKPKRGTIERYYTTVAARFEVDPDLFSPSTGDDNEMAEMLRTLFRDTESDLIQFFAGQVDDASDPNELPLVMKVAIRGSRDEIAGLRAKLEAWLAECETLATDEDFSEDSVSYNGLLAFYPSDTGK
ncbi:MAG: helix-turn-helix domain-containing protein [Woeseiaceae bacterium]